MSDFAAALIVLAVMLGPASLFAIYWTTCWFFDRHKDRERLMDESLKAGIRIGMSYQKIADGQPQDFSAVRFIRPRGCHPYLRAVTDEAPQ